MGYRTYTCPVARSCGGCEWLAVPYPIQLARKQAEVQALFDEALGDGAVAVAEVIGAGHTTHYRHKAATPYAPGKHGQLWCGFYARGTHRIVRCTECLAEVEGTRELFEAIGRAARAYGISAYDEDAHAGLLRHAILRSGWKTRENLLVLVANGRELPREREFVKRVRAAGEEAGLPLTSAVLNVNARRTNAMLGFTSRTLFGSGVMHDELLGCRFEIGPASFYQTNPEQTELLYREAFKAAGLAPGMRVLDAYCGTGTIGLTAAKAVNDLQIIGVERTGEAVACAKRNAAANDLAEHASFVAADATEWIAEQVASGSLAPGSIDAVILDPPRAGSTEAFLSAVTTLAPQRIAYVSCNPKTLVRDLAFLTAKGWRIGSAIPVDLFPHTKHVEMVVSLERAAK